MGLMTGAPRADGGALREASPAYESREPGETPPRENPTAGERAAGELAGGALWLLGRVPEAALPLPLLRAGRAGRGPGPDVR